MAKTKDEVEVWYYYNKKKRCHLCGGEKQPLIYMADFKGCTDCYEKFTNNN
jgi:protein-arginine kinase activator protein McsA